MDDPRITALQALSDESRWQIVRLLLTFRTEKPVGEIGQKLGISESNVSRHIKILNLAGLVTIRKEGRFRLVEIPEKLRGVHGVTRKDEILDLGCCSIDFSQPMRHY